MTHFKMSCPERAARKRCLTRRRILAAATSAPFVSRAHASPDGPFRVITPGAPGGLIDLAARAISDAVGRELGRPWIIDSKPGANGIIAAKVFLEGPGDDHTLYLTVLSHVLLPFVAKVPFDVVADFQPVAMIGASTFLLCVPAESPATTVAEFISYARSNPDKLCYLNSGNATATHLLPEMLNIRYGLGLVSAYYKMIAQGLGDLIAGRLDLGLIATGAALPHVQQGRLKAIAQVSRRRGDAVPGIATLAEQGLPDLGFEALLPLYGRRSMSTSTVSRINGAVAIALADPTARARLASAFIEPLPMQPADVGATMQREHDRWGAIIRQLGITPEGSS